MPAPIARTAATPVDRYAARENQATDRGTAGRKTRLSGTSSQPGSKDRVPLWASPSTRSAPTTRNPHHVPSAVTVRGRLAAGVTTTPNPGSVAYEGRRRPTSRLMVHSGRVAPVVANVTGTGAPDRCR